MSTLDVVAQAGGKPANFLDAGGGSKAEAITSAVDVILSNEKVKAVLFNIFGGITRVRRGRQGTDRGVRPDRGRGKGIRSSCAWTEPTTRRAASCSPRPTFRTSTPSRRWTAQRRRSSNWQPTHPRHEHPRRQEHEAVRLRDHRARGHLPLAAQPRLRHAGRGRRHARQGWPGRRGDPGLQHLPRRRRGDRRQHRDGVRAAPLRRRLDPRGRGRGNRADHRDHRGHPRPRRTARVQHHQEERPRPARSVRTARASSRPARPTSGSSRRRSSRKAMSAWSPAPGR